MNLPGWFGLGTGLDAVAPTSAAGSRRSDAMFREWPFFTALLENAELSLAKADPAIAELYLARGDRDDFARRDPRRDDRTTELVLAGRRAPASSSTAARSCSSAVELRNPYVDALSFLQLRFLDGRGRAERLVQATVNGVAAGLRNTG